MNLKLLLTVLIAGLIHSASLSALGLGPISVNSSLSEAFDADIPITNSADLSSSQILIKLASKADFDRAGVERSYFLTNLEFTVKRNVRGDGYTLVVNSEENVNEPYINFLVEARWPNGRLLREYTVLLDLPQYSAIAKKETTLPPTGSDKPKQTNSVVSKSSLAPSNSISNNSAATKPSAKQAQNSTFVRDANFDTSGRQTVLVHGNDTLSEIAREVNRNTGVSSQQMMLAIKELNPDAFINNNINLLKKGAVLKIPAASELQASQAVLKQAAKPANTQYERSLDARPSSFNNANNQDKTEAHLTLATNDADKVSTKVNARSSSDAALEQAETVSQASKVLSQEVEQLRNELAVSLESLDKASVENADMVARLEVLEAQLFDLESLLSLKNQELSAIRNSFEQTQTAAQLTQDEIAQSVAEQDAIATTDESVESNTPVASIDTVLQDSSAAENIAESPVAASGEQQTPQGVLASLADKLSVSVDYLLTAIVVTLLLLLAVIFWVFSRKKESYQKVAYEPSVFAEDNSVEELALAENVAKDSVNEDEEVIIDEPSNETIYGTEEELADEEAGPRVGDVAKPFDDLDNVDVLAEADIYLAYGKHEQCINLLSSAIEEQPGRTDLRLKLLEVYVDANQAAQFKHACAQLIALGDDGASIEAEGLLHGKSDLNQWWPEDAISETTANQDITQAYANEAAEDDSELSLDADVLDNTQAQSDEQPSSPTLVFDAKQQSADDFDDLGSDIIGTKLDLARAYIDMGDYDGAREILDEVKQDGSLDQQKQADEMLSKIA